MHQSSVGLPCRRYRVVHETTYRYSVPVPLCHNETHLLPRDTPRQRCQQHELEVRPGVHGIDRCLDYFGNHVQFFTVHEPHQELVVVARSEVSVTSAVYLAPESTPPWEQVRETTREATDPKAAAAEQFAVDSPYAAASSELADFALQSFAPARPWLEAVLDLTARIHRDFVYDPTATNISTPLAEVLRLRRGVCQDFAHLQIACLRSLGLAARYMSGYLLTATAEDQPQLVGGDASHAWLACWCPDLGWVELDPTNNLVPSLDHITVAWGRDYSDVCPIKGVFIGGGHHAMTVSVGVEPIAEDRP
jgi:transglutaminase-like putative cysteine protease